jgi:hypothetical protein
MSSANEKQQFHASLSANGFAHLPMNCYENDFTFLVGEKKCECPSLVADFLSPRFSRLRSMDATIHEIVIETPDKLGYFPEILLLCRSSEFSIDDSKREFIANICREFRNFELVQCIYPLDGNDKNSMNVIQQLQLLSSSDCDWSCDCDSLIAFCASHSMNCQNRH